MPGVVNAERATSPDYVQSFARGLDVLNAFGPLAIELTVSDVAARTGLARPTARRLLLTLEQLGYVRSFDGRFALTTKPVELGMAYLGPLGIWEAARPHLERLVESTGEPSAISQLDGSDMVCIARIGVRKIIGFTVHIGTRFPAVATAPGKVLLADLDPDELQQALAVPTQSALAPGTITVPADLATELARVRERGWAMADEELTRGLRAVAAPIVDASGRVVASANLASHAAETSREQLIGELLPQLLETTAAINADWLSRLSH